MRVILFPVIAFLSTTLAAQDITSVATSPAEWFEGSIMLTDNSELKGLVRYNDKTGVLSYENGNTSRSFTPRSVIAFEFFDTKAGKQRLFYSLDYEDGETQAKRPYFFEVLKDYNEFALVSKTDPVEFKKERSLAEKMLQSQTTYSTPDVFAQDLYKQKIGSFQLETVYLFDLTSMSINAIVEISNETVDRVLLEDKTRVKDEVVGMSYLKSYLGTRYRELMEYADQNNLRLENKEELIKIFDYYAATR